MDIKSTKKVKYLVVDTTAFIQNAPLQDIAENIVTCQEVVDEITNKRQLRRLVVLPYDLSIKQVFPENVNFVTDFSKKTGDYPSLSATDIKVMALTYQLEKENVGVDHLRKEPLMQRTVKITTKSINPEISADVTGFHLPGQKNSISNKQIKTESDIEDDKEISKTDCDINAEEKQTNDLDAENNAEEGNKEILMNELDEELAEKFKTLDYEEETEKTNLDDILTSVSENENVNESEENYESEKDDDDDDDDDGWITPSNVKIAQKQVNSGLVEEKHVEVACITTDFAMQNVLKQMNLNVSALDGRLIKQLRTFVLRCYTCFKTTSIMTKQFCPKCGNNTLKRVAVSLDENGKMQVHINARRPLTARGKKFSLPTIKGGKHSNNPRLVEDQPMPEQRPSRLARMKNNPLDDDYITGTFFIFYSTF